MSRVSSAGVRGVARLTPLTAWRRTGTGEFGVHTHIDTEYVHVVHWFPHGNVTTLCDLFSSKTLLDVQRLWTDGPVTCLECLARDQ